MNIYIQAGDGDMYKVQQRRSFWMGPLGLLTDRSSNEKDVDATIL